MVFEHGKTTLYHKLDTMKQDHEKTVLELESKHDQANALHQDEINRIKTNHEKKIHELSEEIKQTKEKHAAEIDSLSMVQKSTIDNMERSKQNEVEVLNKLHAESNQKIQIVETNRKKQICNAMLLKWKGKNILYGFRTWKNYVVSCKLDTMKQDHEKTVLELESKHDQANALHQDEINRIKTNHEKKIHELSEEIKQTKEKHAAEIDSLSMVQKNTIDNMERSKQNEVEVLNKLHAESNQKIQIVETNRKKQICNAMLLKWKGKNILYGFRTWKTTLYHVNLTP